MPTLGCITRWVPVEPAERQKLCCRLRRLHRRFDQLLLSLTSCVWVTGSGELPLLLTVAEAAVVLRLGRTTAYKLAEEWRVTDGRAGLPTVKLGARVMVRRIDLEAMLERPAVVAPPSAIESAGQ